MVLHSLQVPGDSTPDTPDTPDAQAVRAPAAVTAPRQPVASAISAGQRNTRNREQFAQALFNESTADTAQVQAQRNVGLAATTTATTPEAEGALYDESVRAAIPIPQLRMDAQRRRARMDRTRNTDAVANNAMIAEWLQDDVHKSVISYNDYDNLVRLHTQAQRLNIYNPKPVGWGEWIWDNGIMIPKGLASGAGSVAAGAYGLIQAASDSLGLDSISRWAQHGSQVMGDLVPTLSANILDDASPAAFDRAQMTDWRYRQNLIGANLGIPMTDIAFRIDGHDVFSGGASLFPTALAAMMTGGASLGIQLAAMAGTAGLQSFGGTYAERRARGESYAVSMSDATKAGIITGLLTRLMPGGSEKGLSNLTKMLRGTADPKSLLRGHLLKAVGKDFLSEFMEEGLDDLLNAVLVDGTGIEEAITRGLKAGTIGGILGGTIGLAPNIAHIRQARNTRATEFKDINEEVANEMDGTLTAQRSPELAARFMQDMGGVRQEVTFDAVDVKLMLDEIPDAAVQLQRMGINSDGVNTSLADGTPIVMDLARIQANTNGMLRDAILLNMHENTAAPSAREVAEIDQQAEAKRAVGQAQEMRKMRVEFNTERRRLEDNYMQARGVTRDYARDALMPLVSQAYSMWARNSEAFGEGWTPADSLRRVLSIVYKKFEGETPQASAPQARAVPAPVSDADAVSVEADTTAEPDISAEADTTTEPDISATVADVASTQTGDAPPLSDGISDQVPQADADSLTQEDYPTDEYRDDGDADADADADAGRVREDAGQTYLDFGAVTPESATPEQIAEHDLAQGDTTPSDDQRLADLVDGITLANGDSLSTLIAGYVHNEVVSFDVVGQKVKNSHDVATLFAALRSPFVEKFSWFIADADGVVVNSGLYSIGAVDATSAPRLANILDNLPDATRAQVIAGGHTLHVAHNHPSAIVDNSDADASVYQSLQVEAGAMNMQMRGIILDHDRYNDYDNGTFTIRPLDLGPSFGALTTTTVESPEQLIEQVALIERDPESVLQVVVNSHAQIVGIKSYAHVPSPAQVEAFRQAQAAGAGSFLASDADMKINTKNYVRLTDVIREGTISLRRQIGGAFFGKQEFSDQIINEINEDNAGAVYIVDASDLGHTFDSRQEYFQAAYHGSPHTFDAFLLENIGSGEGNQAFGWGLYFTSIKEIAEFYRDTLSKGNAVPIAALEEYYTIGAVVKNRLGEREQVLDFKSMQNGAWSVTVVSLVDGALPRMETRAIRSGETDADLRRRGRLAVTIDGARVAVRESDVRKHSTNPDINTVKASLDTAGMGDLLEVGTLTAVNVPESDQLLQYDTSIDEQAPAIREALLAWRKENGASFSSGEGAYWEIEQHARANGATDPARAASKTLAAMGIQGLEYPADQGKADGRNFVIWDESAIEIVNPETGPTAQYYQSQNKKDAGPAGSIDIIEDQYIINLFQNNNASTILHETGHIFLEETLRILATGKASSQLQTDWQSVASWQMKNRTEHLVYLRDQLDRANLSPQRRSDIEGAIGFFETAEDWEIEDAAGQMGHNLKPDEQNLVAESLHEMWARGFEAFVREGVSPNLAMRAAFGRFRRWLTRIYASALKLNVHLNEDVRGVFNRMLALEAEIDQLSIFNDLTNRSAGELENIRGVNPEKRDKLNKKIGEMKDRAADKLYSERTKHAVAMRKNLTPRIRTLVLNRPVYRAWAFITRGRGLSPAQIRDYYGEDVLAALYKKGLIATKAGNKELMAELKAMDFNDIPDDLLQAMGDQDDTYVDPGLFAPSTTASPSGIPYASGDTPSIINTIDELGGIAREKRSFSPEYDDMPTMRGAYGRMFRNRNDENLVTAQFPDQMAHELQAYGIGDGTVRTMWALVNRDLEQRAIIKEQFNQAKDIEKEQNARIGLIPDSVAQIIGYEDTDSMINALKDAHNPNREIRYTVETEILNAQLDMPYMSEVIASPQFEQIADEIARYLSSAMGGTDSVAADTNKRYAFRDQAMSAMSHQRMRNAVRVDRYEGKVQKAWRDERAAMAGDDIHKASLHNDELRLNSELVKISKAVRKERDATMAFARGLKKKTDFNTIEYAYWYQAHEMAVRFGLLAPNPNLEPPSYGFTVTELLLQTGDLQQDSELTSVIEDFPDWLTSGENSARLNELRSDAEKEGANAGYTPKTYQMMTVYEFEDMHRLLEFMITRGKAVREKKILNGKEKLRDWVADARIASGVTADSKVYDVDSFVGRFLNGMKSFMATLTTAAVYWRTMDGYNGPKFDKWDPSKPHARAFEIPSAQADEARRARFEEVNSILEPHLSVLRAAMDRMGDKALSQTYQGKPLSSIAASPKMIEAGITYWNAPRVLAMMLNMGNTYNAHQMARGNGWIKYDDNQDSEGQPDFAIAEALMSIFSKEEMQAVQGLWDGIDTLWKDSRAVHEELYGFPPGKVKPRPYTFVDNNGGSVVLRGGYWPLRYDTKGGSTGLRMAKNEEAAQLKDIFEGSFLPTSAKRNHLMQRTGSGGALVLTDAAATLNQHLAMTITLITHGRFRRDANRIVNDGEWSELFIQKMGQENYQQIQGWLNGLIGRDIQKLNIVDRTFGKIKAKSAIFALAFNARGPISTLDAVPTLMASIGAKNYMTGVGMVMGSDDHAHGVDGGVTGAIKISKMLEYSTFMRNRLKGGFDRDAAQAIESGLKFQGLTIKGVNIDALQKKGSEWALASYAYPALVYEWPAWVFMYQKTLQETGDHKTAVTVADLAIRATQPSSEKRDLSTIMRDKKSVVTLLTMFKGWAHVRLNDNIFMFNALRAKQLSPSEYLSYFLFTNLMAPAMYAGLSSTGAMVLFGSDDEEEDRAAVGNLLRNIGEGVLTDPLQGLPFVGDAAAALYRGLTNPERTIKNEALRLSTRFGEAYIKPVVMGARAIDGVYTAFASDDRHERAAAMWAVAHFVSYSSGIQASALVEQLVEVSDFVIGDE